MIVRAKVGDAARNVDGSIERARRDVDTHERSKRMKTTLTFVGFDGCDINADTGEIKIKNILLRFDPKSTDLHIDLLNALDLAVKAIKAGTIKPTYVN